MFDNPTSKYEYKHAFHSIHNGVDVISIRYIEHTESGEKIPHFEILVDYERPAWVTLSRYRNHVDKKTYESINKLQMIKSTEARMASTLSRVLNRRHKANNYINNILSSPYVYGLATTTTSHIKHKIMAKWPELVSDNIVAVGDIETCMNSSDEHILCMAVTCKDKVYSAILKDFVKNIENPIDKLHEAMGTYLDDTIKNRIKTVEFVICDTPALLVINCLKKIHEWKPDFFAFWNMDFDIPKCITALEREGYDPKDYFNDPSVPKKYRHLKYIQQKSIVNGRKSNKSTSELWHILENHASWYVIDPMCYYRKNRAHLKQELNYTLEHIGDMLVNIGKLKFDKASHIKHASRLWHMFMQTTYPIEYCIYNINDCILVELIDEVTNDLSKTIQNSADIAEYQTMFSLPSVLEHRLQYQVFDKGVVLGQAGTDMKRELDNYIINSNDIIVMLPSHLIEDNGIHLFDDAKNIASQCRAAPADDDVESTYPSAHITNNLERETIKRELVSIDGINTHDMKQIGYDITNGIVNSVSIVRTLYNYKSLIELDDIL